MPHHDVVQAAVNEVASIGNHDPAWLLNLCQNRRPLSQFGSVLPPPQQHVVQLHHHSQSQNNVSAVSASLMPNHPAQQQNTTNTGSVVVAAMPACAAGPEGGGATGGMAAHGSAIAKMKKDILEIIQDAIGDDDGTELDLLLHVEEEMEKEDSRIHRQIATNVGRSEASRKTAAALFEILMKIGKKEMQKLDNA